MVENASACKRAGSTPAPSSLLVKPVGALCNLRCEYCFYQPEARGAHKEVMQEATLQKLMQEIFRLPSPELGICWQGGEPTLAGVGFFEQALAYQREYGKDTYIAHSLQTNGLLIDAAWTAFLQKESFLVGISLDGPKAWHDAYRYDTHGNGAWQKVMDAVHRLQDAHVKINALCCLTPQSVQEPEELFHFFVQENFEHVQFIPLLEAENQDSSYLAPFAITAEEYGAFLCRTWDMWLERLTSEKPMGVRFFESFCHRALDLPPTLCEMYPGCGTYAVVEHDGCIYPCDFFVHDSWQLGTLAEGLPEVLQRPHTRHFNELRLMHAPECHVCDWRIYCHGGCLKFRKIGTRLAAKTWYCEAYKRFFAHAHKDIARVRAYIMSLNGTI